MNPFQKMDAGSDDLKKGAANSTPSPKAPAPVGKGKGKRKPSQMDRRQRLSIICGVLAGVAVVSAGFGLVTFTTGMSMQAEVAQQVESVVTVKEGKEVKPGQALTQDDLETVDAPSKFLPADAVRKVDDIVGKVALTPLTPGAPISASVIETGDDPATVTATITKGHVAKMFSFDTAPGMSPLLRPGDYVTLTGSKTDQATGVATTVSFNGVRIVAVDGNLTAVATDSYSTLTFELTQEQSDKLAGMEVSVAAEPASEHGGLKGGLEATGKAVDESSKAESDDSADSAADGAGEGQGGSADAGTEEAVSAATGASDAQ